MLQCSHNAISYHEVPESVAAQKICIAYTPFGENLADMSAKILGATKLNSMIQHIFY